METKVFRKDSGGAREWNERRWAMVKMTRVASVAALAGLTLGLSLLGAASPVQAKTTSDRPAAILYWPKIIVDTTGRFSTPAGTATDTLIRLSNTATGGSGLVGMKQAHCFYIDANSHCSNSPSQVCQSGNDCGVGSCLPGWSEIDFDVVLTKDQPLTWHVSEGLRRGSFPLETPGLCSLPPVHACVSDAECNGVCVRQQSNLGSGIPPVPEDPFVGSLECIEYDPTAGGGPVPDQTDTSNTLKGEATIEGTRNLRTAVDIAEYNAVGIRFGSVEAGVPSNELHLDGVQYDTCPTTLILDHLFDEPTIGQFTDLTLVPCGDDFLTQTPGNVTAQFVVFNEFEQRFSTSRSVPCFLESVLSNLDTPDSSRSIFSQVVSGTLGGQTRIRGVGSSVTGRGLVGVARLTSPNGSAAYNLHQAGSPAAGSGIQPDVITIP